MFYENGVPKPPKSSWYLFKLVWSKRWEDLRYLPKQIKEFLRRLWLFLPVIWRDRDYDYSSIYSLLKVKLEQMAKHMREHDMHVCSQRRVKQMEFAVFLIDKISDDYYWEQEMKEHESYWGENIWDFVALPEKDPYLGRCYELKTYTLKAKEEGREEEEKGLRHKIHKDAEARKQKDIKRLFRHIEKYHQGWWC